MYYCTVCEKPLTIADPLWRIKVSDEVYFLHKDCILRCSGGIPLDKVEFEIGAEILNEIHIFENGDIWWYNKSDKRHRTDGPAVEYADGSKYWYIEGKLHRTDRPAIERADGTKAWWIKGEFVK